MAKPKSAATSSASPPSTTASSSAAASRRSGGRSCKGRSLACRECRDRKIRCDGGRPTCDSCRRRGLGADQCVYPEIEHEGSIASSRSYIRVLQKRVQELEAREQHLLARNAHPSASSSPSQPDDAWARPYSSPNGVPLQPKPTNTADQVLPPIHSEILGFPPNVVTTTTGGSLPVAVAHEQTAYYSHHSPPLTDDLEDASPIKSSFGSYSTNVKAALMLEKIALPAPEVMDDLLAEYFDLDWTTMPVVHKPSFGDRYHRLTAVANSRYRRDIPLAEATELATTFSLLLGMLAIGQLSKHGNPTPAEISTATEFHQQAKALLLSDLTSAPSLQVVQALIIHARFLRRCGMLQDSWVLNGLAQRLAEGLLLHLDLPAKSVSEHEERRRTWCACVLSIRMQNVAHGGMSSSTNPSFGALPAEIDDELMDSQTSQPAESPCWTSFFVQMLKLSDSVLQPIQRTFFDSHSHGDSNDAMSEILSAALRLDGELQDWHSSLPRHLQVDSICSQGQMGLRRQALLLHMRYLETKVLLSRAAIMKLVQRHPGKQLTAMSKALLGGIIDVCCTSSNELVDLMVREKDLLVLAGTPQGHVTISLCITGMTLSMLLKMPILHDLIRNPAMYADDIRRCLTLGKQFYTCRDQVAEKYIQVFEAAVQVQPRFPVSPGVVDPALEAKALPANAPELGGTEMAMLEAWYLGRPEMLASLGGFSVSEILGLW